MAQFFIDRPVFAWVISIIIMLAGGLAILELPVEQYPKIAPPAVTISATYPGASAKPLEDAVTQVIEQKMTGIEDRQSTRLNPVTNAQLVERLLLYKKHKTKHY